MFIGICLKLLLRLLPRLNYFLSLFFCVSFLIVLESEMLFSLVNAAQLGIGRVQVLGSKQVQEKHLVGFHQSSGLTATKASNISLECGHGGG